MGEYGNSQFCSGFRSLVPFDIILGFAHFSFAQCVTRSTCTGMQDRARIQQARFHTELRVRIRAMLTENNADVCFLQIASATIQLFTKDLCL